MNNSIIARVLAWYKYQLRIPQWIDFYLLGRSMARNATIVKMQKLTKNLDKKQKRQVNLNMCVV